MRGLAACGGASVGRRGVQKISFRQCEQAGGEAIGEENELLGQTKSEQGPKKSATICVLICVMCYVQPISLPLYLR